MSEKFEVYYIVYNHEIVDGPYCDDVEAYEAIWKLEEKNPYREHMFEIMSQTIHLEKKGE